MTLSKNLLRQVVFAFLFVLTLAAENLNRCGMCPSSFCFHAFSLIVHTYMHINFIHCLHIKFIRLFVY